MNNDAWYIIAAVGLVWTVVVFVVGQWFGYADGMLDAWTAEIERKARGSNEGINRNAPRSDYRGGRHRCGRVASALYGVVMNGRDIPAELLDLARNCPTVHAYLREWVAGRATWEDVLLKLVIELARQRDDALGRLIRLEQLRLSLPQTFAMEQLPQ